MEINDLIIQYTNFNRNNIVSKQRGKKIIESVTWRKYEKEEFLF